MAPDGHQTPPPTPPTASGPTEAVTEPAKLLRVIGMTQRLLDELHHDGFGPAARARANTAYEDSLYELHGLLSDDLRRELDRLAGPLRPGEAPSEAELRVAEAQLTGWLEGLMQGLQADRLAQQAGTQLAQSRQAEPRPGPPHRAGYR